MNNLSIKTRLLALVGTLLALLIVSSISGVARLKGSNDSLATVYNDRVIPLRQLKAVSDGYGNGIVDTAVKVGAGVMTPADGLQSLHAARTTIAREWQAYLATYIAADAVLKGKPLPQGWVKVPHVVVDKTNIAAYQKAWEKPETGLRAFYNTQIEATRDHLPATLPDNDLYTHPPQ